LQTAIPNCESRKAYAQLLLDEDINDIESLIANNNGILIDRVDEDFEPYSAVVNGA
jgi:hypothetical protein